MPVAGQFFLELCLLMRWVGQICMVTFRSLLLFSLQEIHAGYLWLIWHSAMKRVTSSFGEVVTLIQEEAFSMITINRNQKNHIRSDKHVKSVEVESLGAHMPMRPD